MLPVPRLDDRTFAQLVREARDMIPGILPEWTDENAHDPGITLLEMLAWHLEVQQYRLDQLTESHERKFLKLLGDAPGDRQPARSQVIFSDAAAVRRLRTGTVLRAGEIPYETEHTLTIVPNAGVRLQLATDRGLRELPIDDENGHAPFYPFGRDGEVGASFRIKPAEPLPANEPLSIRFELVEDAAARRIPPFYPAFVPSGEVEWRYETQAEDGGIEWRPLALERDETHHFHQSGSVRFSLPEPASRLEVSMAAGAYDRVPVVRRVCLNEASVVQGLTHAVVESFDGTGEAGLCLTPGHALFRRGFIRVQTRMPDGGWADWEEVEAWPGEPLRVYRVRREDGRVRVLFGDGDRGALPPEGEGTIRLAAVSAVLHGRTLLGAGTGTSAQSFALPLYPVLPDRLLVQVGQTSGDGRALVWHDWERVTDFDRSMPGSRHYLLDDREGELRFPDGVRGAVPPASPVPNIRVLALREGGGERGNVKEGSIAAVDVGQEADGLRVENLRPAAGGAEPETTGEALRRVRRSVLEPDCGVTADDIERLVGRIPGLAVAKAKAIPGYRPGLRDYPAERSLGDITVVVVPATARAKPKPSTGFVRTVRNHLEPYRLLTTRLHIVPPEYVTVTVRAVVVVTPRYDDKERRLDEAVNRLFDNWAFGRPVYKGDVYDAIHRVPGVVYIQDVWLMADGKDVLKDEGGDVRIPPNALVVSGRHEMELISSQQ